MIAVIFEATAEPGQQERYLQLAAEMRAELDLIKGFISIERFKSLNADGKILSLSWWENEESVIEWKRNIHHQAAQLEGRQTIFADYRIRIAEVLRDYSSNKEEQGNA